MSDHTMPALEEAIHHSRRSFWMLLIVFVLFTASVVLLSIHGSDSTLGTGLLRMSPIFIAIFVGLAGGGLVNTKTRQSSFKALAADELRMQSLGHAYRIAFFGVLIVQPILALLAAAMNVVHPIGLMAGGSVGLAMIVFLSSFLWLDR